MSNPFETIEAPAATIARPANLPPDGCHEGVPMATYLSWDTASNSRLEDSRRSLAYARYRIEHPEAHEDTPATILGTACHTAILEPDTFDSRYLRGGTCEAKKADGVRCTNNGSVVLGGVSYCGVHAKGKSGDAETRIVLPGEAYDTALAIRDSVWYREWGEGARRLLRSTSVRELSVVATDEDTGCPMKARFDVPAFGLGVAADVKITRQAHRDEFPRFLVNYGGHRQGAFYQRVIGAVQPGVVKKWSWIVIEPEAPHEVAVRSMNAETFAAAWNEVNEALVKYAAALRSGYFEGYENDAPTTGVPAWALPALHMEDF